MMAGDAQETRKRLLAAATAEFAAHGVAGARVDRIAQEAGANKSLIYAYFGSKEALFDAVYDAQVVLTIDAVPFDAEDLPGYAGRLFDYQQDFPLVTRLTAWSRLERVDAPVVPTIVASNVRKLEALAAAQATGHIPTRFAPVEILGGVLSLASMWSGASREAAEVVAGIDRDRRRQAVIEAVTLLLTP